MCYTRPVNISPEQKLSVPVYPSIKMVLVAAAASTVALVSCDRHSPTHEPSDSPANRPTEQTTPKPDEQVQQLGGVVPFVPDSEEPSGVETPGSSPDIEPQLLLGAIAIPDPLPEQPTI